MSMMDMRKNEIGFNFFIFNNISAFLYLKIIINRITYSQYLSYDQVGRSFKRLPDLQKFIAIMSSFTLANLLLLVPFMLIQISVLFCAIFENLWAIHNVLLERTVSILGYLKRIKGHIWNKNCLASRLSVLGLL